MNQKRMDIKSLLDLQGRDVSHQSWRRRTFYYKQLQDFKLIYTRWKKFTYYVFLTKVYNVPKHLHTPLSWVQRMDKKYIYMMKNGNL